jgi:hypothetical protein
MKDGETRGRPPTEPLTRARNICHHIIETKFLYREYIGTPEHT